MPSRRYIAAIAVIGLSILSFGSFGPAGAAGSKLATSLALAGHTADRLALFVALTHELDRVAGPGERSAALAEWRARSTVLGREVEVTREGRPVVRGVARDIADDGALLVGSERVVSGDVRALA